MMLRFLFLAFVGLILLANSANGTSTAQTPLPIIVQVHRMGRPIGYYWMSEDGSQTSQIVIKDLVQCFEASIDGTWVVYFDGRTFYRHKYGQEPEALLLVDGSYIYSRISACQMLSPDMNWALLRTVYNDQHPPILVNMQTGSHQNIDISMPAASTSIRWSPDSKKLAMPSLLIDGKTYLFVVDLETGQVTKIAEAEGDIKKITWMPNSEYLAFTANSDEYEEIYYVHVDGTELRQLTQQSHTHIDWLRPSPDGSSLYVLSRQYGLPSFIKQIDLTDLTEQTLITTVIISSYPDHIVWSQDQETAAYISQENEPLRYTLHLFTASGIHTTFEAPVSPLLCFWTADNTSLIGINNNHIYRININDGSFNVLTEFDGQDSCFSTYLFNDWLYYASWQNNNQDVYRININGGVPQRLTTLIEEELIAAWSGLPCSVQNLTYATDRGCFNYSAQ